MTPEGTDMLTLALTSQTRQSVVHHRHRIYWFWLFPSDALFHTQDLESSRYRTAFFINCLTRLNQHLYPASQFYGIAVPGSSKMHSISPAWWCHSISSYRNHWVCSIIIHIRFTMLRWYHALVGKLENEDQKSLKKFATIQFYFKYLHLPVSSLWWTHIEQLSLFADEDITSL